MNGRGFLKTFFKGNLGLGLGLRQLLAVLVGSMLLTVATGCRLDDNRIRGNLKIPRAPDFLKTEMIENGPAPADGSSELLVVIHLKNSNGSVVPNYRPEFEIVVNNVGVTKSPCTESSREGYSVCVLRATQPGVRVLRLVNAKVGLEKEVVFEPPMRRGQILGLISGSETGAETETGGYWGEYSVGDFAQGIEVSTDAGHRGFLSVQGAFISQ